MCVFAEVPANVAKYLPETIIAQSQQSSIDIATKMSLASEPVAVLDHENSSPFPRPLKHRRITPTALSASPLQQVIVPTAVCVPAATQPQKPRRITPISLAEDCPSVSGNDVKSIAEAPSSVQAASPGTPQEISHTTSSVLEVTSSGPNKRLRITPIAVPGDAPLGPSLIEKISRPSDCDPNKFRSMEACFQERHTDLTVPPAVQ